MRKRKLNVPTWVILLVLFAPVFLAGYVAVEVRFMRREWEKTDKTEECREAVDFLESIR